MYSFVMFLNIHKVEFNINLYFFLGKSRGELIGKSERSKTDMKRERRKKKLRQGEVQKSKERKEKDGVLRPGMKRKQSKNENAALVEKVSKARNVTKMDETSHRVNKSSTAFFTQLQDQVQSAIKAKTGAKSVKKTKNTHSAVHLKL